MKRIPTKRDNVKFFIKRDNPHNVFAVLYDLPEMDGKLTVYSREEEHEEISVDYIHTCAEANKTQAANLRHEMVAMGYNI